MKTTKRLIVSFGITMGIFAALLAIIALVVVLLVWIISFIPKTFDPNKAGYYVAALSFLTIFVLGWRHAYNDLRGK
jgi:hypothetical protein